MSYKAKDGKMYSNRPAARSHDAHIASRSTAPSDRHQEREAAAAKEFADPNTSHDREVDLLKELGAQEGLAVTCPSCGHSFNPDDNPPHGS